MYEAIVRFIKGWDGQVMSAEDIIKIYGPSSLLVLLLIYFLCRPEALEKWATLLYRIVYFITKQGGKRIVKHDIQSRINGFSRVLGKEIANYEPVGINIEWVKTEDAAENFFSNNRVIIRMRHHQDQDKNFVIAAMAFISQSVLSKAKKYLSQNQRESIDLYVCKDLCHREKPRVEEKFFDYYFGPKTDESKRIREFLNKYEIMHKVGLFYGVLVQELNFLGEKVFAQPRNQKIVEEATRLIDFLEKYAYREVGDENIPTTFKGNYCRCGIMIVGKSAKVQTGKIDLYLRYIARLVHSKIENIYLIGPALKPNESLIQRISTQVQEEYAYLEYFSKKYKATIRVKGNRYKVNNFLVLMRSVDPIRFYDEELEKQLFGE